MKTSLIILLFIITSSIFSQTFTGTGGAIPDDGNSITFTINVSGLNPATIDTVFGFESVCINIMHTWDSDLSIALIAPDGSIVTLTAGNGGNGDGYVNTCFNDTATLSIFQSWAPFTGDFRPQGDLGVFNNGQPGNGIWKLFILDTWPWADTGELFDWSITFSNHPAIPFQFSSSNLSLVILNTNGQIIPDNPKINADMKIISNGPGILNYPDDSPQYHGTVGIELRGSSSQSFPKKSYGFNTLDQDGYQIDTTILGMPSESDWVLIANFSDKTIDRKSVV